ncbi:uncharacterized protein LOC108698045 isoform X2 [Xenopus laevis]|uniref:Uncharacterized protein LOC108698045 isoform X2 n=1 Tax=Xenopus laevis TaxID=8355 RepID=A0A8J1MSV5_XENLA|nr:uncharacterized protein LOC108698045 isoform X2 [Xenopus laevis]
MEPASKKTKLDKSVLIRLCDAFTRTDGKIICPLIKAENSVRVLYKLQEKLLYKIVREAGLPDPKFLWKSAATDRNIDGNLFVKYSTSQQVDENSLKQFQETLKGKLREVLKVKHILIDRVEDTENVIPQPIISETSFEFHKLKVCYESLFDKAKDTIDQNTDIGADLYVAAETIKSHLEDLKGQYTKFAVLSQNGKGKSFILNLLMLLTADNEEEYRENNRNLKLPQAIDENKTVEEIEEEGDLPDVVKDVLTITVDKTKFARAVLDPLCCKLPWVKNIQQSKLLSNVDKYFSKKRRIDIGPYILAEKEIEGSFESTTKCIIHLRYGTLYQIRVNYFTEEELQQQLFELVTWSEGDSSNEINESIKEKAKDCLKARFGILTDYDIPSTLQEMEQFQSPEDILLSREVAQFAGKTELYIGDGKDAQHDRLAMKSILRQMTTSQEGDDEYKKKIAAVKQIVIYLPSKILYGGKEILEMPGTDDSDPMAMNFIETALNEVDAVIVISDFAFKIAEKEVKDMLSSSDFVKSWKENPCNHKLMLLAYPEKNQRWQFGKHDTENIKKLEKEERKKRTEELKYISKILRMEDMMDSKKKELEASIITAYILPVLHTSILAQPADKGKEYRVFQENEAFLQYTGISNLITIIDSFVSSRQQSTTEKIRNQFSHLCQELCDNSEGIREATRTVLRVLTRRELKSTLEDEINRNSEELLIKCKWRIEQLISEVVNTKMEAVLKTTVEQAKKDWMINKDRIQYLGVFNPYFAGKNPVYKVLLFNIFFDGLKGKKTVIFKEIRTRIEALLQQYKKQILKQLMQTLNMVLGDQHRPFTLEFVENAIEDELDDALLWYVGNVQRPFNEKAMRKFFKMSQNNSIRENILKPNFKKEISLETAKQNTEQNIEKCIMEIKESFFYELSVLHEERYVGNVQRPFNEKAMRKFFTMSQNNSIRENILKPNFKKEISLETAKQNIEMPK